MNTVKAGLSSSELLNSQQIEEAVNFRLSLRKESVSKIEEEGLELRLINEDKGASSLSSGKFVNSSRTLFMPLLPEPFLPLPLGPNNGKLRLMGSLKNYQNKFGNGWDLAFLFQQPLFQGSSCFQGAGYNSSSSCVQTSSVQRQHFNQGRGRMYGSGCSLTSTSSCGERTHSQQQSASSRKGPSCGRYLSNRGRGSRLLSW